MQKPPPLYRDYVIVKVESIFKPDRNVIDADGNKKTITIDTSFEPEKHAKCSAEVVDVPRKLSAIPVYSEPLPTPAVYDEMIDQWYRLWDIKPVVQKGDKIYFHYSCLIPNSSRQAKRNHATNENYIFTMKEGDKLFHYYKLRYDQIYAAVRYIPANAGTDKFTWDIEPRLEKFEDLYVDSETTGVYRKEIEMVGGHVFIEPILEDWDDILIPVPIRDAHGELMRDHNGNVLMKPKEQWIATKSAPQNKDLIGKVLYIDDNLADLPVLVKQGDIVQFKRGADTPIDFEGQTVWRMHQRWLFCVVENQTS